MLHKIIGSSHIVTPFLRFTTDSGAGLDPVITTSGSATFEWISPDGSISTGTTPNPTLDQTGMYTIKCSDWSDVTKIDFRADHITIIDNLSLLISMTQLFVLDNSISILDVSALISLAALYCRNNSISILDISTLTSLVDIQCHNNNMSEVNVDHILADLVTASAVNGALVMGGTNAAPSAAGDADVLILEGRGWTVTTS